MKTFGRSLLIAAAAGGLLFGAVGCNKNKEVETDPAAEAPAPTSKLAIAGTTEVADAAFHPSEINEVIKANDEALRACFEKHGSREVSLDLTINGDGHASAVKSDTGMAPIDKCLNDVLGAATFPKPNGDKPVTATVKLSFTAAE